MQSPLEFYYIEIGNLNLGIFYRPSLVPIIFYVRFQIASKFCRYNQDNRISYRYNDKEISKSFVCDT